MDVADESAPPAEWFRAACAGELQSAFDWLNERKRDRAVHEARKCLRRVRAWLRLLRPKQRLALKPVDAEIRRLRRLIGPLRDAASRIEAVDALLRKRDLGTLRPGIKAMRAHLVSALDAAWRRRPRRGRVWSRVLMGLAEQIRGVADWPLEGLSWRGIERGWDLAHRRACSGRRGCKGRTGAVQRHQWRRRVRVLVMQSQLLGKRADYPALPKLKRLAQQLGDENDLALVGAAIARAGLDSATRDLLRKYLRQHRRKLAQANDRLALSSLRRSLEPRLR